MPRTSVMCTSDVSPDVQNEIAGLIQTCFHHTEKPEHVAKMDAIVLSTSWWWKRVMGTALLEEATDYGLDGVFFVLSVCVLPAYRRMGVGKGILQEIHKNGYITLLHIDKGPRHDELVRRYERCCFEQFRHATQRVKFDPAVETLMISCNMPASVRLRI